MSPSDVQMWNSENLSRDDEKGKLLNYHKAVYTQKKYYLLTELVIGY